MATITGSGVNSTVTLAQIRSGTAYFCNDSNTTHSEIKALQTAFTNWGYYTNGIDGKFGSGMEAAVKGFQNEQLLTINGRVDKATLAKLEGFTETITDDTSITPTITRVQNGLANFKSGHSGSAINQIRTYLISKGYSCASSGSFDSTLVSVVKTFQTNNGLTSDGIVGQASLAVLQDTTSDTSWLVSGTVNLTAGKLARAGFVQIALRPAFVLSLNNALNLYGINTKERVRHFLAQVKEEIGAGTSITEYVYRAGTGASTKYTPYCGAGYLQLTWDYNYTDFQQYMKTNRNITDSKIITPSEYATQHVAVAFPCESAAWFWKDKNLNALVDAGGDPNPIVVNLTLKIKNSTSSSDARYKHYQNICGVLK